MERRKGHGSGQGRRQLVVGRRKVKMIDVGSVLRLRDGLRCGDAGLSYTRSVDQMWKRGNCSTNAT